MKRRRFILVGLTALLLLSACNVNTAPGMTWGSATWDQSRWQ